MHKGKIIDGANGYGIIECDECRFVHIDPLPTQPELDEIYKKEYYTSEKPMFIERVVEDIDWWNIVYNDRYDFIEANTGGGKSIIDIGCGPGYFLKRGMERGWKCLGVEPSLNASGHASGQGIEVMNAFLDDLTLARIIGEGALFDAAHLSEVLEHVPNPADVLAKAAQVLKPGGLLCVVVPNDYSPVQSVLRRKLGFSPYWLAPPHHINYFTFASLSALMERAGFDVINETAMFPIDFFLLMGDNYVGNDPLGRASHGRRKKLDIMLDEPELKAFKTEMYSLMARHGIGREMIIYARKK